MAKRKKTFSIMTFQIRGLWFGVPLKHVEGVAPLREITAVPGVTSRIFQGLTYTQGKIMAVIDIAPLLNKKPLSMASDAVVLQLDDAFYAFPVEAVGTIIGSPKLTRVRNTYNGTIVSKCEYEKKVIQILGVESIIQENVPCT